MSDLNDFKNNINHKICSRFEFRNSASAINDSSRDVCCTTRNEESWTPVFSFSCWTSVHIHCHMLRGHCCQTANAILPNGTDAGQLCRSRCCCTSKVEVELFFSSFFFLHPFPYKGQYRHPFQRASHATLRMLLVVRKLRAYRCYC